MNARETLLRLIKPIPLLLSTLGVLAVLWKYGFQSTDFQRSLTPILFMASLAMGLLSVLFLYVFRSSRPKSRAWWLDAIYFALLLTVLIHHLEMGLAQLPFPQLLMYLALFWVFLREVSAWNWPNRASMLSPARLFVGSYIALIFLGTLLMLLPNATVGGISFMNALFTATSAVCVTGMMVLDTSTDFTRFGQVLIMLLFQAGGIGIMTFTSYFSYFFRGESSYQQQMILRDLTSSDRLVEVFNTLKKIILLTFVIEAGGALLVWLSLDHSMFERPADLLFFSVFHAISGFCNAGFSTFSDGLYEPVLRYNYPLHLVLAAMFIIGGMGFPILFNFWRYLRHLILNQLIPASLNRATTHSPWIINLNTRLVLITTAFLLVIPTCFILVLEWNNALSSHRGAGRLVEAFFIAAVPRSAGFNVMDFNSLHFGSTLLIIFLMWVGASPASTGGGIKTSTLAMALINIRRTAREANHVELFGRHITEQSLNRAFAIIVLSMLGISLSVFTLSLTEPEQELFSLVVESIAAYSTAGISQGITAQLSESGKMVIIITMLCGRVGLLSVIMAFMPKTKIRNYRYPSEDILIN